ncbi:MAG: hypothetical protein AMXMBFR84_30150 [Candidatus Hydrogenedentota bacterium]
MKLHPSFIEEDGKRRFAVLPIREYENLTNYLEDLEDLLELRHAKKGEANEPAVGLDEAEKLISGQ